MPPFTFEGIICAIFGGYFARNLKLHVKMIKENKKRLYIYGIITAIFYIGNVLFYIFETKDVGALIWDMAFPVIILTIIYYTTHGDKEKYELTQKIKEKPEIKKSNTYLVIFLICYLILPIIAFAIYTYISGNESVYIQNEDLGILFLIIIVYLSILFVASALHFNTFKKHYLSEINKKTDDKKDS